jgi:hypothetical protein
MVAASRELTAVGAAKAVSMRLGGRQSLFRDDVARSTSNVTRHCF